MGPDVLAYARQKQLFKTMDVVANNVANSNTPGFKADLAIYSPSNNRIGGEINPSPKMNIATDLSAGGLVATNNPLDVAIEGEGFFAVESPLGTRYTKSGSFTVNSEGVLVTNDGWPVQSDGGEITFEPTDSNIEVADNGEIYAFNNGIKELRGQLGIFKFDDTTSLQKVGNTHFRSDENPALALFQEDYVVAQGMLEQSNTNSILQITTLIEISRAVGQTANIISQQHELERNTLTRITDPN